MSHYSIISTTVRDPEALEEAIHELEPGWEVERYEAAQPLYDYMGKVRPERAHVIVRRKFIHPLSNDMGFVRESDGNFRAIISDYDQSIGKSSEWLQKLTQLYAKHKTLKEMRRQGWRLGSQTTREDGTIKLVLEV